MPAEAAIEELLDLVPELRGDRTVSELVGGLTNTNYKVETDAGAFVVRVSAKDAGMLAIDRENEYLNSVAAADAGVGAEVIGYLPERSLLVLGFIEGETQSSEDLRRGDKLAMVADACRRLHGARRFRDDFNMFDIQRRYLALVQERGFRLPDRYVEFEPQGARDGAGDGRPRRGHRALQQRPAGRELHRHRRLVPADRLRVLGQQRRLLRAGQRVERVEPLARPARRADRPLLRPAAAQQGRAGAAVGADVEVRLDAVGVDPGRRVRHRLRLLGVGHGEVRPRPARVRRPRLRAPAGGRAARRIEGRPRDASQLPGPIWCPPQPGSRLRGAESRSHREFSRSRDHQVVPTAISTTAVCSASAASSSRGSHLRRLGAAETATNGTANSQIRSTSALENPPRAAIADHGHRHQRVRDRADSSRAKASATSGPSATRNATRSPATQYQPGRCATRRGRTHSEVARNAVDRVVAGEQRERRVERDRRPGHQRRQQCGAAGPRRGRRAVPATRPGHRSRA